MFVVSPAFRQQLETQMGQLKLNPVQFLINNKFNINPGQQISSPKQAIEMITGQKIPDEYTNNPNGYYQYLMQNSQLNGQQQEQMNSVASFFHLI